MIKELKVNVTSDSFGKYEITGLICSDFEIKGHSVNCVVEHPAGTYTVYFEKKLNYFNKISQFIRKSVFSLKSLFTLFKHTLKSMLFDA